MPETIEPRMLTGWEIEALPNAIVRCDLRFVVSIEAMAEGEKRYVPLLIGADQAEALARLLSEKAAQSRKRNIVSN